jgi:FkbM family methyltransferase
MHASMRAMNRRDFMLGNAAGLAVGAVGGYAGRAFGSTALRRDLTNARADRTSAERELAKAQDELAKQGSARGCPPEMAFNAAHGRHSYAQWGEDILLKLYLDYLNEPRPQYIDIGAWDPVDGNNTYLFYSAGAHGVLVEPNPTYYEKLRTVRTRDKVINAGLGATTETQADYYVVGGDGQLNTFSKKQVDEEHLIVKEVLKMPIRNVNKVLEENFTTAPALFSVDTEGFDLTILKTLDFARWRPKVFCVETIMKGHFRNEEIVQFMQSKGYAYAGGHTVNSIFLDANLHVF